jgi:phosphoribosylformimino-5-aminoimidazole carboxamide ribotide isomerase
MLLIIPAIHIRDGKCYPKIDYYRDHHLPPCEAPSEEPRLLRKENAKALHLFFDSESPVSERNLAIIKQIRTCVDLPLGLTLQSLTNLNELETLTSIGVYRIFLKNYDNDLLLSSCLTTVSAQRISPYIKLDSNEIIDIAKLKSIGFSRVVVDYDPTINPDAFQKLKSQIEDNKMRLTLVSSVSSYEGLMQLDEMSPVVDSVVLNDTLEHDPFPCQGIWRLAEERAFLSVGKEANLWKNPLEGTVHI